MKYRLYISLILLLTVLTGCTNATVNTPVFAPIPQETAEAQAVSVEVTPNEAVPGKPEPGEPTPSQTMGNKAVPNKIQTITISAVGDIMVHDNSLASVKTPTGYDFDPPFTEIMPIIQSADLAIGNLETTISGPSTKYTGYPRFNSPDTLLDTLKKAGFDVLITSNNHSLDRGTAGLVRTIDQLDERGFLHTGTYKTKEDSEKLLITDVKGIKIAILAYSYGTNGIHMEKPYMVNLLKLRKMLDDVNKAKRLQPDVIITYLHMGDECIRQPNQKQKDIVDSLMKAGVNIVLGDHPHVVQPMERRTVTDDTGREKDAFVIYSLGNFISGRKGLYRDLGSILNIKIEKDTVNGKITIKETHLIPTWVQFYDNNGRDSYRVMPISLAIEKYENKQDSYITAKEYGYLKDMLIHMVDFVNKGPAK